MDFFKSIEEQQAGKDQISKVLLTVCLAGIALMVSIFPEKTASEIPLQAYWLAVLMLGLSVAACLVSLLRRMTEAELVQENLRDPEVLEALVKLRSDPNVQVRQSPNRKALAFRLRIINRAFRGAVLFFVLWLVFLAIFTVTINP